MTLINTLWTLQDAVALARIIEPVAIKNSFHVALGGSCLIQGFSDKDCDIFCYQHTNKDDDTNNKLPLKYDTLLAHLTELGILPRDGEQSSGDFTYKIVIKLKFMDKPFDLILLRPA